MDWFFLKINIETVNLKLLHFMLVWFYALINWMSTWFLCNVRIANPHLRRRAAASMGAKPYMVLGLVYILQNSYLCINVKFVHCFFWYIIKVMSFENCFYLMKTWIYKNIEELILFITYYSYYEKSDSNSLRFFPLSMFYQSHFITSC